MLCMSHVVRIAPMISALYVLCLSAVLIYAYIVLIFLGFPCL